MDRSLMRPADRLFTPDHARCPTPHGPFGQTSSPDYPGTPAFRRSRSKAAPTASPRTPSRSAAALVGTQPFQQVAQLNDLSGVVARDRSTSEGTNSDIKIDRENDLFTSPVEPHERHGLKRATSDARQRTIFRSVEWISRPPPSSWK